MEYVYNTPTNVIAQEFKTQPDFECWPLTPEIEAGIVGKIRPQIIDGAVVETATTEEIAEYKNNSATTPISRMQFWINVWRILGLTEENIVALIMKMPDSSERQELLIMIRNANEFDRFNDSLIFMARQMNISDEVLNLIFS